MELFILSPVHLHGMVLTLMEGQLYPYLHSLVDICRSKLESLVLFRHTSNTKVITWGMALGNKESVPACSNFRATASFTYRVGYTVLHFLLGKWCHHHQLLCFWHSTHLTLPCNTCHSQWWGVTWRMWHVDHFQNFLTVPYNLQDGMKDRHSEISATVPDKMNVSVTCPLWKMGSRNASLPLPTPKIGGRRLHMHDMLIICSTCGICFLLGMPWFQISVQTPATLTDVFLWFLLVPPGRCQDSMPN
jgi:hypothetical protein